MNLKKVIHIKEFPAPPGGAGWMLCETFRW